MASSLKHFPKTRSSAAQDYKERNDQQAMEGNPTAGENFRHPAPHECRLAMTGIPCKTSIVTEGSLVSAGALNSGGASVSDGVLSTECRVLSQMVH